MEGGLLACLACLLLPKLFELQGLSGAALQGLEQITDEEFKAELDYLVEYYGGQYTAEYIRENMGDDAIKENALYTKVQNFILDRTTIKYE